MNDKLLITIWRDQVAPRFDLTSEVLVATVDSTGELLHSKTVILPAVSAEGLCHLILTEGITTVICGGIEEEYFQYLTWKKVRVIDSVIATYDLALEFAQQDAGVPDDGVHRGAQIVGHARQEFGLQAGGLLGLEPGFVALAGALGQLAFQFGDSLLGGGLGGTRGHGRWLGRTRRKQGLVAVKMGDSDLSTVNCRKICAIKSPVTPW